MGVGQTIGRYRLIRLLGRGGMGDVFLAGWQGAAGFERLVALKVLGERFAFDKARLKRLVREAQIGVHLDHANIVSVLDLDAVDGRYFIAMEHVRGFNLQQVIAFLAGREQFVPLPAATHVVRALARALDYVHSYADATTGEPLGLMHGDVSPSNALLAADGRIKLSDFGVASLVREARAGSFAGKVGYTPPEVFAGGAARPQWDLYALGVVLYETLSGKPAFASRDFDERRRHAALAPRDLREIRADLPDALVDVVERAIAFEPDRRFASARQFLSALDVAVPRTVAEADRYRDFVADLYARDDFVREHGALPTTGRLDPTRDLAPLGPARTDEIETADNDPVSAPTIEARPPRKPLRFGLSPALGPDTAREHGARLAQILSRELGSEVRPVVFGDYHTLVDCLSLGEVDIAWMPPLAFVAAARRGAGCALKLRRRGDSGYRSAVVVRADAPIATVAELGGKRLAWVDRDSAGGYVFAAALLAEQLGQLDQALAGQHFHGSYRGVADAVLNGWADAGAVYSPVDAAQAPVSSAWLELFGGHVADVRALAFSEVIPADNIAHRPGLAPDQVDDVARALRALAADPAGAVVVRGVFNAEGFDEAEPGEYEVARAALAATKRVA